MRGRRCCCCLEWYGLEPDLVRMHGKQAWIDDAGTNLSQNLTAIDFVNHTAYGHSFINPADSVPRRIIRWDKNLKNMTTVKEVDSTKQIARYVTVHPFNKHIFYAEKRTGSANTVFLMRCDYDGSNETELLNFVSPNGPSSMGNIRSIAITKDGKYIFYDINYTQGSPPSGTANSMIKRCDADGSNNIEILNPGADGVHDNFHIDNKGNLLYFSDGRTKVRKCYFNGETLTTIYDRATATVPPAPIDWTTLTVGWSHSNDLLYVMMADNLGNGRAGRGLYSMKADGTDIKEVAVAPNFYTKDGKTQLGPFPGNSLNANGLPAYLGCGFEKFGPGTQAST